ncbi:MAG: NADH-quinone oxidoreductase subunit C [Candidatus Micrarchaeaceae archaeon]
MLEIQSEALARTLEGLRTKGFDYLKKITAVDRVDHLEVVYILYNFKSNEHEIVLTKLPADNPEISTVMKLYKAADWYERELSEMFGIKIKGRKAKRLLLEKWNGAEPPLRKSFQWANPNYKKL